MDAREARRRALEVAARVVAAGAEAPAAIAAAAEALASDPWAVVEGAGALARAAWAPTTADLGLDAELGPRPPDDPGAVVVIPAGGLAPRADRDGRRARGAFDTPRALARATVAAARQAAVGPVQRALDPCCGAGALLVALVEAGVPEVIGTDLDPLALAVARVAAPGARVEVADALDGGAPVDLVVGNPPFVPPERQDKALRARLRERLPWLSGRYDLAVPLAWASAERARRGGGVALVVPVPVLAEPYGEPLRRRWLAEHAVVDLLPGEAFRGAAIRTAVVVLRAGAGPAPVGPHRVPAAEILALPRAPLDARHRPGDAALAAGLRARSVRLGDLCEVDTGLVAHGPGGGKARLLADGPGPGVVPFAEARDVFAGRHGWLRYAPERMHRPKRPALFEPPKLVVQRLCGAGPVRARVDRSGVYVGHTCTVAVPVGDDVPLDRLRELLVDPLLLGLLRLERGDRLDLYPRDVAGVPVPVAWKTDPTLPLEEAWELSPAGAARLRALAASPPDRAR